MSQESMDKKLESTAIDMEVASVKLYERLLAECDEPSERRIYREIIADEKDHERKMKKIRGR